jgi:histidinol phosphatase-like enzyme (inositol monophosphatase family)
MLATLHSLDAYLQIKIRQPSFEEILGDSVAYTYKKELKVSLDAARAAGKIQLAYRGRLPRVETKTDASPVTKVDRKCETVIRDILMRRFPADGFLGEETGYETGSSGRTWIVDPLDGTRPFLRGIPTFSVLIALQDGNDLTVGCMHLPALGETYWAQKGRGAYLNGKRIYVSKTRNLSRAMGSGLGFVEHSSKRRGRRLLFLMKTWDYAYGFMDAYSYGGVACGRLDVCVNLLDKPWDCAAAACIVAEAGGAFSDVNGNRSVHNGSVILSNGFVHDAVLEYFQ